MMIFRTKNIENEKKKSRKNKKERAHWYGTLQVIVSSKIMSKSSSLKCKNIKYCISLFSKVYCIEIVDSTVDFVVYLYC